MSCQDPTLAVIEAVQAIMMTRMPMASVAGAHHTVGVPARLVEDLSSAYAAYLEARRHDPVTPYVASRDPVTLDDHKMIWEGK